MEPGPSWPRCHLITAHCITRQPSSPTAGSSSWEENITSLIRVWTSLGAIYDPVANTWTPVAAPPFFGGFGPFPQTIGDSQSVVLFDGTFMQANCCTTQTALLDAKTLTWTETGSGKFDINDEEGWTLLPNKQVLTVDAYVFQYDPTGMNSEIYNPASGKWRSAGSTVVQLWDSAAACGGAKVSTMQEVGPAVLRPDGTVFYTGSNTCGAGHTAIYNSNTGNMDGRSRFSGFAEHRRWSSGADCPTAKFSLTQARVWEIPPDVLLRI